MDNEQKLAKRTSSHSRQVQTRKPKRSCLTTWRNKLLSILFTRSTLTVYCLSHNTVLLCTNAVDLSILNAFREGLVFLALCTRKKTATEVFKELSRYGRHDAVSFESVFLALFTGYLLRLVFFSFNQLLLAGHV